MMRFVDTLRERKEQQIKKFSEKKECTITITV